jgi:hypothetical protein
MWRIHKKGTDEQGISPTPALYAPPDIIESIAMTDSRVEGYTAAVSGSVRGMTATSGVTGSTSSAGAATAAVNAGAIIKVAASAGPVDAAGANDVSSASAADGPTGT